MTTRTYSRFPHFPAQAACTKNLYHDLCIDAFTSANPNLPANAIDPSDLTARALCIEHAAFLGIGIARFMENRRTQP